MSFFSGTLQWIFRALCVVQGLWYHRWLILTCTATVSIFFLIGIGGLTKVRGERPTALVEFN